MMNFSLFFSLHHPRVCRDLPKHIMSAQSGIIYCYGNCQLKSIAMYLRHIPLVSERYPIIEYFYVLDDVIKLDREKLVKAEVFIYQHTTAKAMVGTCEMAKERATSEYLVEHVLPKNCLSISIPSVYSSILFPNVMTTKEAQTGFPSHVPAEVFPNYTFNRRLHDMLRGHKETKFIVNSMLDPNAYSITELKRNEQQNYDNLRKREIDNKVTIPLAEYIRATFRKKRLLLTTNHPSSLFFDHLLNEVLKRMQLPPSSIALELEDPMVKLGKAPLLPCVIEHLQLDMTHPSYADDEIWACNQSFKTYTAYVDHLKSLLRSED